MSSYGIDYFVGGVSYFVDNNKGKIQDCTLKGPSTKSDGVTTTQVAAGTSRGHAYTLFILPVYLADVFA